MARKSSGREPEPADAAMSKAAVSKAAVSEVRGVHPFPDLEDAAEGAGLSPRQRRVLEVIRDWVDRFGYPPSVREIGEAVGLTSTSSVAHQLRALERKGYLRRDPNRPRAVGVRPVEEPEQPVDEVAGRPRPIYVPVVGRIAAGGPVLAEQAVEDVFPLPREIVGEGSLFLLRVAGDSMIEGEATVKTFKRQDGHVWLLPRNPAYEPIPGDEATVLGRVVAVLRRL